jgi:hypothetical protein
MVSASFNDFHDPVELDLLYQPQIKLYQPQIKLAVLKTQEQRMAEKHQAQTLGYMEVPAKIGQAADPKGMDTQIEKIISYHDTNLNHLNYPAPFSLGPNHRDTFEGHLWSTQHKLKQQL